MSVPPLGEETEESGMEEALEVEEGSAEEGNLEAPLATLPPMAAAKLSRTKPEAAVAREEGRSSGDSGSGVYLPAGKGGGV